MSPNGTHPKAESRTATIQSQWHRHAARLKCALNVRLAQKPPLLRMSGSSCVSATILSAYYVMQRPGICSSPGGRRPSSHRAIHRPTSAARSLFIVHCWTISPPTHTLTHTRAHTHTHTCVYAMCMRHVHTRTMGPSPDDSPSSPRRERSERCQLSFEIRRRVRSLRIS